jgi:hypothetical protein
VEWVAARFLKEFPMAFPFVTWWANGKRRHECFPTFDAAKEFAEKVRGKVVFVTVPKR